MAVKETRPGTYEIDFPGFEGVEFTKYSDYELYYGDEMTSVPDAVKFASDLDSILVSARESVAYYLEPWGHHEQFDCERMDVQQLFQVTRTGVVLFKDQNKFYAAIDDIADPAQNIVVAYAERICETQSKLNKNKDPTYLLPMNDRLVKGVLSRAEKAGRIVEVGDESEIERSAELIDGKSEFGQNPWVKSILVDMSEPYTEDMNDQYGITEVRVCTNEELEKVRVDRNNVAVQLVGLRGEIEAALYVYPEFTHGGIAAGIRKAREVSPEHRIVEVKDKNLYERVRKLCA